MISSIRKSSIGAWAKNVSINNLLIGNSVILGLSVYQSYVRLGEVTPVRFILTTIWTVGLLAYFSSKYFKRNWLNKAIRKFGYAPILWFASLSIWFGDILAFGVSAQATDGDGNTGIFFSNIQRRINGILGESGAAEGATDIINFGFGILRLALILYIAFAIFKAVKAQQNDEEWIESAKVPLIVLFAVTAGDFAVQLI